MNHSTASPAIMANRHPHAPEQPQRPNALDLTPAGTARFLTITGLSGLTVDILTGEGWSVRDSRLHHWLPWQHA